MTARIRWLIDNPPTVSTAAITAYRANLGFDDLFSVIVRFSGRSDSGFWRSAKIYALVKPMEARLPPVGATLILTAGDKPVAEAEIEFVENE